MMHSHASPAPSGEYSYTARSGLVRPTSASPALTSTNRSLMRDTPTKAGAQLNSPSYVKTTPKRVFRVPAVARLESELQDKDRKIEKLKDENKTLTKLLRNKDASLAELAARVEAEKEAIFKNGPRGDLVQQLKHETREKEIVNSRLQTELHQLQRDLGLREQALMDLNTKVEHLQEVHNQEGVDVVHLESDVKVLMARVQELEEENKTLLRIQRIKTWAIEKLTNQLDPRGGREDEVTHLQNEVAWRDKDIFHMQQDLNKLNKVLADSYRQDQEVTVQMTDEERDAYEVELRQVRSQNAGKSKTIKEQKGELDRLHEEVTRLKGTVAKLNAQLQSAHNGDRERQKLMGEIQDLKHQLLDHDRTIARKNDHIERLEREVAGLADARVREEEHQRMRASLQNEIEVLRKMIAKKENEFKTR